MSGERMDLTFEKEIEMNPGEYFLKIYRVLLYSYIRIYEVYQG